MTYVPPLSSFTLFVRFFLSIVAPFRLLNSSSLQSSTPPPASPVLVNPKSQMENYNRCPILFLLVSRYRALCGFGLARIGTCSTILSPYPSRPTTFLGLL